MGQSPPTPPGNMRSAGRVVTTCDTARPDVRHRLLDQKGDRGRSDAVCPWACGGTRCLTGCGCPRPQPSLDEARSDRMSTCATSSMVLLSGRWTATPNRSRGPAGRSSPPPSRRRPHVDHAQRQVPTWSVPVRHRSPRLRSPSSKARRPPSVRPSSRRSGMLSSIAAVRPGRRTGGSRCSRGLSSRSGPS